MKFPSTLLFTASLGFIAAGCGTMSVPKLETHNAEAYEQHVETSGLVLGVHPMTDKAEVKRMFNVNLLDKGLLPILVVAENHNPAASFIIAKEKVFVLNEATGATNISQRKEVASGQLAAGSALAVVTAGGLVSLVGIKMASDAMVMEYGVADKEFGSKTLGPGQRAQGFLYFQFPKGTPPSGDYHVVARIKNSSTEEVIPFDFKVNLALTKP